MFVMVWGYHHSSECFLFQCTWPGLNCFAYTPTLSHTWYVSRGERTRVLEEAGTTGGDRGHMKLNPEGRMQLGQWVQKLACLGEYKTDRPETCRWWRQGWQRLDHYLGNIRVNVQNLATYLGRKGRRRWGVTWGLEGRDTRTSTDHDHKWRANKWKDESMGNWDSVFHLNRARSRESCKGSSHDWNGWTENRFASDMLSLPSCLPACLLPYSACTDGTSTQVLTPVATRNAESSLGVHRATR